MVPLMQAGSGWGYPAGHRYGERVQVVSEPEACDPWMYRHAPTLTRPRWGREPSAPDGFRWWKLVQGGDTLLGAGGE
ncbi:MAG: hypothetical protein KatS3mg056_0694 [Chloroflexus sp.]|nr:MAG: hypothetical protein KatS3mg056_0694 [Chloroflexus sp.]